MPDGFGRAGTQMLAPVRCENLVMPPGSTRGPRRRDDPVARYTEPRMPTPMQRLRALPQVAPATVLDVAGARCSGRRTLQGSARGVVGSESAASRDIPCGRCAPIARRLRPMRLRCTHGTVARSHLV